MSGEFVTGVLLPTWAPYVGVLCMLALAVLARHRECSCEKCGFHVNEARLKREKARASHHRANHAWWRGTIPWGSPNCPDCRKGHEDDRP